MSNVYLSRNDKEEGKTVSEMAEGRNWVSTYGEALGVTVYDIGGKALIALGKLTFGARFLALEGVRKPGYADGSVRGKIRVRDLNWAKVREMTELVRSSGDRTDAIISALLYQMGLTDLSDKMYPLKTDSYPDNTDRSVAADIILGKTPREISGGVLTKKEAHLWLLGGGGPVNGWLANHLGVPRHRSDKVIRWLHNCKITNRWEAIEKERTINLPGGQTRVFTALQILDEIQAEDIVTGKDSVTTVLRRSADRLGEKYMLENMHDYTLLVEIPQWVSCLNPERVKYLATPAVLIAEGKVMKHCVGGYKNAVADGLCHVLSIRTPSGCSTVELDTALRVVQHFKEENDPPEPRNIRYVNALVKRLNAMVQS